MSLSDIMKIDYYFDLIKSELFFFVTISFTIAFQTSLPIIKPLARLHCEQFNLQIVKTKLKNRPVFKTVLKKAPINALFIPRYCKFRTR